VDNVDADDDVTVDCVNNCATLTAEVFSGFGAQTDTYAINVATPLSDSIYRQYNTYHNNP